MKQDEVIFRLKSIVHSNQHYTTWTVSTPHLVQLVNSAIEMEREACSQAAAVALLGADRELAERVVRAIRARGEQE
jgi:hypothetical protein